MLIGINAGFGEPIAHELDSLRSLGFRFVRQDFRTNHSDSHIQALVSEFAHSDLKLLALLAGGHIDKPEGGRVEPHELADLGRRIVRATNTVGLSDFMIEVGNEPDLAHLDYKSRPQDFAVAVQQTTAAIRGAGFHGPIISGGICNLSGPSLQYLERMLLAGLPDDVILGFHRYPNGLTPQNPQKGFKSREAEWRELQRLASGRQVACTELGHHTAPRKYKLWGFIPLTGRVSDEEVADHLAYDLRFFQERGCMLAAVYQLNDGPSDQSHLHRYGIRRLDGTWKPVAQVIGRFGAATV